MTATAIQVGDLVTVPDWSPRLPGTVQALEGTSATVKMSSGETLYRAVDRLTRISGDRPAARAATANAIQVGDLVCNNGAADRPGVVRDLTRSADIAQVELCDEPGGRVIWSLSNLTRVDANQLMRDTIAAETTELPAVNLFAPVPTNTTAGPGADELAAELPPAVVPDLGGIRGRRGPVDDLRSMLILLDCLTGLDFAARHPDMTPGERLEHVERVRCTATGELLALIEARVLALSEPIVGRRHGG